MQKPRLVIVYIGSKVPYYLIKNLEHIQRLFPGLPKSLVLDLKSIKNFSAPSGWETYLYKRSPLTEKLLKSLDLDDRFRDGFWMLTLERLLAFLEVHELYPDEPLLQIEGDVILMPDFPFEKVLQLSKLAWLRNNSEEDIATLIYSPTVSTSEFLAEKLRDEISNDSSTSDMRALRSIAEQFPNDIHYLPTSPGEENDWRGVFDPLAAGIWLLGVDPRNEAGRSVRRRLPFRHPALDVERLEFRIHKERLQCRLSYGEWVGMWCLHLHSKNPRYFEYSALIAALSSSISGEEQGGFSVRGLIEWVRELLRDVLSLQALKKAWQRLSKFAKE